MPTILIVDSDISERNRLRNIIGQILRRMSHPPVPLHIANTPEEAIGFLETDQSIASVGLLITRYEFPQPGPNGLDLVRYVNDRFDMKKVLMIEDRLSFHDRVAAAGDGVDVIIRKPVTAEKLTKIIRSIMG